MCQRKDIEIQLRDEISYICMLATRMAKLCVLKERCGMPHLDHWTVAQAML